MNIIACPCGLPTGAESFFSSVPGGRSQVYVKAVSGLDTEHVVSPRPGDRYATTWAPDGQFIAGLQQTPEHGGPDFLLLPMSVNQKPMAFLPGATGLSPTAG